MSDYFQNSIDHIMAEIKRIELMLQSKMISLNHDNGNIKKDKFEGLYITEEEVEAIIGTTRYQTKDNPSQIQELNQVHISDSLKQLEGEIYSKKKESLLHGITLRLDKLEQLFQLTPFDIDILLVCLLPEIDLKYQRLYAYLQNDITQKNPTVNLTLELLCKSFSEILKSRNAFSSSASLIKHQLVHLNGNHSLTPIPLLAKSLQIDGRILHHLLEIDQIDSCLLPFTQLLQPKLKLEEIILPEKTKQVLTTLIAQRGRAPVCHLHGDNGVGKKSTAEAICAELGIPILYVELNRMLLNKANAETLIPLILREGMLQNAALYLNGYDVLLTGEDDNKSSGDYLLSGLKKYPQWVFVASNKEWRPKESWQDRPFVSIELPLPSYSLRRQLWEKYWDKDVALENDVDFNDLANKFRLTGGQIRNVVINARNTAKLQELGHQIVSVHDLSSFCRNESRDVLHDMARKIQPKYCWQDIILPTDLLEQLREIYNYVKYYYKVYSDWGFEKKLSLGKGLNVLFSGPSGTGKTMTAEIIAHELQLDLYKIDLSTIVSKYIGETEKNLSSIFKEGQASNAILFFDEADAIFGKRSEVKDAHDRYANIEISYLLQKMEEYDGMVVLATNFRKNIDDAFSRRMHFTLDFPIPDEPDRKRIWQSIFPTAAPLGNDIDFAFLARQFQITGGNIKNIALGAAFLAAQNGNLINMKNIIRATKREYQKMGKLCTEEDFADYMEIVK
jgi:SpoVK/Ycf46/Vps4 family AAA+-type ATPase